MATRTVEVFGQKIRSASNSYGLLVGRNRESGRVWIAGYIQNPARIAPRLRSLRRELGRISDFEFVAFPQVKSSYPFEGHRFRESDTGMPCEICGYGYGVHSER